MSNKLTCGQTPTRRSESSPALGTATGPHQCPPFMRTSTQPLTHGRTTRRMRLAGGWMGRAGDDTMAVFEVRCEHAVVSGEMGAHTADENTADTRSKLDALGCESTGGENRELVSAMTFRKPGGSIALLSCTFDAINNISGRHTASQSEPDLSYMCSPLYRHVGWGFCDTARAVLDRNVDIVKSERDADNRSGGRPCTRLRSSAR